MASNASIDYLRRKKVPQVSLEEFVEYEGKEKYFLICSESPNPEEKSIKKQQNSLLKDLVNTLPNRYRILINLYYFEE